MVRITGSIRKVVKHWQAYKQYFQAASYPRKQSNGDWVVVLKPKPGIDVTYMSDLEISA
jgi:hypothetical protein